jgi:hypothetical protein
MEWKVLTPLVSMSIPIITAAVLVYFARRSQRRSVHELSQTVQEHVQDAKEEFTKKARK